MTRDAKYLEIILDSLKTCYNYKPRFGYKNSVLNVDQFQKIYSDDPLYRWFGLNTPLMYTAHKTAGGMTSVYRQLGIGCEKIFRQVLQDELKISDKDLKWSHEVINERNQTQILSLDVKIKLDDIDNDPIKARFGDWMQMSAQSIGLDSLVLESLVGTVFEIRQGYKSKDSKRQNADITNASLAYATSYLPCIAIMSTQIDRDVLRRYREAKWVIITGEDSVNDSQQSTFDFMRDVIGYDLAGFFERNAPKLQTEINSILQTLLRAEK